MVFRKEICEKTWSFEKLDGKLRILFFLMVAFCIVIAKSMSVNAEEILDGGSFSCEAGTGTASWKLNADGELIFYGDGTINEQKFNLSDVDKDKVKKIYCETTINCRSTNFSYAFANMPNLEYVNLNPFQAPYVTYADRMFANCPKLKEIHIKNFCFKNCVKKITKPDGTEYPVIDNQEMFYGCESLIKITTPNNTSHISELPTSDGYNWFDEKGKIVKPGTYSGTNVKVISGFGDIFTKEPIKYTINYTYTTYTREDDGVYFWNNGEKHMSYYDGRELSDGSEGFFNGYSYSWTENNPNPTIYTIEDEDFEIQAPSFAPEGYKLAGYTPKTIKTSDTKYIEVNITFVPEDLNIGDADNDSEADGENKKEEPTSEHTTSSTESSTQPHTTEQSTITEKSTEVSTNISGNTSESVTANNSVVSINDAKSTKTSIKSASNSKGKKIKLSLKEISGYKYQIKVSTSKKFNKYVKTYTTAKTSYTISKLQKGKNYYIKVRTYKSIDGNKVYGKWSAVKRVKVNK